MKQGINIHMPVRFTDIDLEDVQQIEFVFKKINSASAEAIKTARWKSDGTGDAETKPNTTNVVLVPWTRSETYLFPENKFFYMDTRITMIGSTDNPPTNIVAMRMHPTLFEEGDA